MSKLQVVKQQLDGISVIAVRGSLDNQTFRMLNEEVGAAFREGSRLVVDLSGVDFVSSAGAGVLIGAYSTAEQLGGAMVLAGVRPLVMETFKVLGLDQVFAFAKDAGGAIRALQAAGKIDS